MESNQADAGLLKYEAGQTYVENQQMTDAGDHLEFSVSDTPWSKRSGYEPEVRPDGLRTGGVISASATNDKVAITDLTCYINGEEVSVSSISEQTVDRSAEYTPGETYLTNSITVTSGGAIAILQGGEGASFSTTRGADGGPPLIPTTSIEIGWVRFSSKTAAVVLASEMLQIPGTSQERASFPIYENDYENGKVTFVSALPAIHTGSVTKEVWVECYTPIFASLEPCSDFVPAETSYSQNSQEVYGGAIGSVSSSLNQGSFTYYALDGITENVVSLKGAVLWFQFYPDRLKAPYLLTQGKLGIARTYPAGGSIAVACTISANVEANEHAS